MRAFVRTLVAVVAVLVAVLALGGCGGDDSSSTTSDTAPKVIDVTFKGDSVTPNGDRVDVKVGQTVEFKVTADQAGEIHVHSSPEQELEYGEGSTTLELTIDKPGLIEVESHALDKTIVQLQVQ